jgi:hypothetical protein
MENNKKIIHGNCWVAYLDILGFKNLMFESEQQLGKGNIDIFVKIEYFDILNILKRKEQYWPDKVFTHWFSDSFLFYTSGCSKESYICIEQEARHFFIEAIWKRLPLRGALTVGEFYVDKDNNIFVGPALIDAYEYAEKQDWLGFLLTPNARDKLKELIPSLAESCIGYADFDVPVKPIKDCTEKLLACRLGNFPNTKECIAQILEEVKNKWPDDHLEIKAKYKRTLEFMDKTKFKSDT